MEEMKAKPSWLHGRTLRAVLIYDLSCFADRLARTHRQELVEHNHRDTDNGTGSMLLELDVGLYGDGLIWACRPVRRGSIYHRHPVDQVEDEHRAGNDSCPDNGC